MYYVYCHIRLDKEQEEIFYVGVGTVAEGELLFKRKGNTFQGKYYRAFEMSKSRNPHWKNIVRKIGKYKVAIVFESENLQEVLDLEIKMIKEHRDTVCNIAEGGLGVIGYNHTEESKQKISNTLKNRVLSDEVWKKINDAKYKPIFGRHKKTGEVVSFSSLEAAADFTGRRKNNKNISAAALNKRATAYGYEWWYELEDV